MNAYAYGLGTLGRDMLAATVSLYLMYYVTEILGVGGGQLAALTAIMVAMRIFDAVNDPVMGWIVDNTRTRWGKFRPWMAGGALLWAAAGVAMFTDWGLDGWALVAVFALTYLAYELAYTINDIAYWGMLPALSRDKTDRDRIGAIAPICANLGLFAVVVGIVPGTAWLAGRTGSETAGWTAAAVLVVVIMLAFHLLTLLGARERVTFDTGATSLRGLVTAITRNDQLLWTALGMTLFMTGYTTTAALALYYFRYVVGDEGRYPVFALVLGVTQIVALALFPVIARRVRRFRIHLVATVMIVAGYLAFLITGGTMAGIAAAGVLVFAGQAAIQLLLVLFVADSVEYGQWKLGRRNESVTFAVQPFVYKLSSGLSTAVVGGTLLVAGIGGNEDGVAPSGPYVAALTTSMFVLPLILVAVSYLVLRARYRLDEDTYDRIVAELRAREATDA